MNKKIFNHLSYEERIQIAVLLKQGLSIRKIAKELSRHHSCIAYELSQKRIKGQYVPKKAHQKSYWRRYRSKINCMKVALDKKLADFVEEKLEQKWSPERISGYLKNQNISVSTKAIYKYTYSRCLERYLFWKNHKKKPKSRNYINPVKDGRKRIDLRPNVDGSGHLEADFIVSSKSNHSLLVIVDKYNRNTWIKKLPNRKHATVMRAFWDTMFSYQVKTITLDNDIAFNCWVKIEKLFNCQIYFCQPYHSWEKGLVENTNRWIRTFVPKRKDIREVTEEELHSTESFLNEIPRQCLGYRTAKEVLLKNQVAKLTG